VPPSGGEKAEECSTSAFLLSAISWIFFYFHRIYRILVNFLMNRDGIAEKIDKILSLKKKNT